MNSDRIGPRTGLGPQVPRRVADVLVAAALGGGLSGVPSTAWTLVRRQDVLASTRAAGTLLPGRGRPSLAAGVAVHTVLSLGWAAVLSPATARCRSWRPLAGGLAGLGIAALDLGVIGRRYPAVRALPLLPQVADHIAFGTIVTVVLEHRRESALGQTGASR